MKSTIGVGHVLMGKQIPDVYIPDSVPSSACESQEQDCILCDPGKLDDHLRRAFAILVKGENGAVDFDPLVRDMTHHLVSVGALREGECNFGDQLDRSYGIFN
jgi:hypothetical protein